MIHFAAVGADDALIIIIIVVVVVGGGLLAWLSSTSYRLVLTPSATTMPQNRNVTVTVTFQQRNWRLGAWSNAAATIATRVNSVTAVLGPSPQTGATTAAAPTLTITVTGTNPGSDTLIVTATVTGGTATASGGVPLTVTPG
ncbi:MAG: hypothetical protein HY736_18110 [Verrucomicrobia bacterium]|nr:hypothetical protein [Verrucomicrobiota bacterium]